MAADDGDPFEQGKLARFNNDVMKIPIRKTVSNIRAGKRATNLWSKG